MASDIHGPPTKKSDAHNQKSAPNSKLKIARIEMAQMAIKNPEITRTLEELANVLPNLFRKMKELKLNLKLLNLPHDRQFEGKPVWDYLPAIDPSEVRVEKEGLVLKQENTLYRIHHPRDKNFLVTLKLFLKWATESLEQLTSGINNVVDNMKTLQVPQTISFFSASTLPPRKPSPLFG